MCQLYNLHEPVPEIFGPVPGPSDVWPNPNSTRVPSFGQVRGHGFFKAPVPKIISTGPPDQCRIGDLDIIR